MAENYGNVFSMQFGRNWVVLVNGLHLVKEALVHQGENFIDRPKLPVMNEISGTFGECLSFGLTVPYAPMYTITNITLGCKLSIISCL